MPRLIADRYVTADRASLLDLATGKRLRSDAETAPARASPLLALTEVLDQGRDGHPRALVHDAADAASYLERAAGEASANGFVPVAVDVYLQSRPLLDDILRDRALLLLQGPGHAGEVARHALVDACGRSSRPHVLLTVRGTPAAQSVAREARPAYGVAISPGRVPAPIDADIAQHLRRAARAGQFVLDGRHAAAERLLRDVAAAVARRRREDLAVAVLIDLGRLLLERGRAADADGIFGQVSTMAVANGMESSSLDARLWQAAARTDAGRLTEAESICRALLAAGGMDEGRHTWALAALGRVLWWQGRVRELRDVAVVLPDAHGLEETTAAWVMACHVRFLVLADRVFDAGARLEAPQPAATPLACAIAAVARLRWQVAAGDLDGAAGSLRQLDEHARLARVPLRGVRGRLLWVSGLVRAGRHAEAARELRRLERVCRAGPPLLRRAVRDAVAAAGRAHHADSPQGHERDAARDLTIVMPLIAAANDEAHDEDAIARTLRLLAGMLDTSRIDVCSNDAGPVSVRSSAGSGLPTQLGTRVLEAGLTLGPERQQGGLEVGVPVRRGVQLVGAVVARWPADRTPPADARHQLEVAAAIVGPRIESLLARSRVMHQAAVSVPELVGDSAAIGEVRAAIARAALAPFSVMIQGESGVGKELVARAIHQLGPRRERRFCDVNCAALLDDLVESELFGHAKGAFTGAVSDRRGMFEDADGGTLFLDELADLSLRAQAKLLRVLQQQEVRRVGETFSRKVDVRVVTAANRDMAAEAAAGRFRQDLLYRLDVIRVRIPPLRDRPEDVAPLSQHFWRMAAERTGTTAVLTHGVTAALTRYHWPGNVRELQNVISALAVAAPARGLVRPHLLPAVIAGATGISATRLADARAQFERRAIESALARAGNSRSRAARELGLSRQGLLKMMARLNVAGWPGRGRET